MKVTADAGFHAGELAVQQRAGVRDDAARLSPMLAPAQLRGGTAGFLAGRNFAVMTGRDKTGQLWTSPLAGRPGFLDAASPAVLTVRARVPKSDPLHGLPPGQQVGLVVVEFATRRRVRVNGVLSAAGHGALTIEVEQAYGNCPQYIRRRAVDPEVIRQPARDVRHGSALTARDASLAGAADTFFLGTGYPGRGSDASHRGGPPGFVRVLADGRLCWADFPGNNMFNSLGNLAVDPAAALLFLDFATGRTLQLSGTATIEWNAAEPPGDDAAGPGDDATGPGDDATGPGDDATGRRVLFSPQQLVARG